MNLDVPADSRLPIIESALKLITPPSLWYPRKPLSPELFARWKEMTNERLVYDCSHAHDNACLIEATLGAFRWLERAYKIYLAIHVAQHLVFKKDKFKLKNLLKLLRNIFQTYLFFGIYAFMAKLFWCKANLNISDKVGIYPWVIHLGCAMCASAIFLERPSRWPEFGMNILPRVLESMPTYLGKRHYWIGVPFGINIILSFSVACISWVYFTHPSSIKPTFRKVGSLLLGPPDSPKDEEKKRVEEEYK